MNKPQSNLSFSFEPELRLHCLPGLFPNPTTKAKTKSIANAKADPNSSIDMSFGTVISTITRPAREARQFPGTRHSIDVERGGGFGTSEEKRAVLHCNAANLLTCDVSPPKVGSTSKGKSCDGGTSKHRRSRRVSLAIQPGYKKRMPHRLERRCSWSGPIATIF